MHLRDVFDLKLRSNLSILVLLDYNLTHELIITAVVPHCLELFERTIQGEGF